MLQAVRLPTRKREAGWYTSICKITISKGMEVCMYDTAINPKRTCIKEVQTLTSTARPRSSTAKKGDRWYQPPGWLGPPSTTGMHDIYETVWLITDPRLSRFKSLSTSPENLLRKHSEPGV